MLFTHSDILKNLQTYIDLNFSERFITEYKKNSTATSSLFLGHLESDKKILLRASSTNSFAGRTKVKHFLNTTPSYNDYRVDHHVYVAIGFKNNALSLLDSNNKISLITVPPDNLKFFIHGLDNLNNELKVILKSFVKYLDSEIIDVSYEEKKARLLEVEVEEEKSRINLKNVLVFINASIVSIKSRFESIFHGVLQESNVKFTSVSSIDQIDRHSPFVIIIVGFDVHDNEDLIFQVIQRCEKLNVPFKTLFQKDIILGLQDINLNRGAEIEKLRDSLEKDYEEELITFSSHEEFETLILNIFREHKPTLLLKSLKLTNIGHFSNANINFNEELTCIVGENGQGKSSILRALALSILGTDHFDNKSDISLKGLLKINSIDKNGQTSYASKGQIKLQYSLDGIDYQNSVTLTSKDQGRIIDFTTSGDFELKSGEFNLKSLIVGFPQLRGRNTTSMDQNKYTKPHIDDLTPLLYDSDDQRLDSFINWIANLFGDAKNSKNHKNTREFSIIQYAFQIISELTGSPLSFITVQQFTPPILIVSSQDSPSGVPLKLLSQGFKIVIGWIGYFIQRRVESFPLSSPKSSSSEKSILIIDEIDSSIHPIWQSRLLKILRDKFPTTQVICTTHSPLMVAGLDRDQILEISRDKEEINVNEIEFDTWTTNYRDILRLIFNTPEYIPTITKEELQKELKKHTEDRAKSSQLLETIERLIENEILTDDLKKYELELKQKEKELDKLIEEYKNKIQ
ncbi:MAG: AAA family ATPase [Roseivirga sp.]|nr:AAA family ATPase [Roseivirga sp.]